MDEAGVAVCGRVLRRRSAKASAAPVSGTSAAAAPAGTALPYVPQPSVSGLVRKTVQTAGWAALELTGRVGGPLTQDGERPSILSRGSGEGFYLSFLSLRSRHIQTDPLMAMITMTPVGQKLPSPSAAT